MTARTTARLSELGVNVPTMGTVPIAADTQLFAHTLVGIDSSGNAVNPSDDATAAVTGVSVANYDNSTGSDAGGLAGDIDAELLYGLWGFFITGTDPLPGQRMYVVDNQTVSTSSSGGTRGFAGICIEFRDSEAFMWIGPHVGQGSALNGGSVSATIGMAPAWVDGVSNGFDPVVFAWAFNPTIDDEPVLFSVALPDDMDANFDAIVTVRAAISSIATDPDVTVLVAAHIDGGSDIGPTNATALTVLAQNLDFTIPKASITAGDKALFLSIRASDELDTHDAYVFAVEFKYTKKS